MPWGAASAERRPGLCPALRLRPDRVVEAVVAVRELRLDAPPVRTEAPLHQLGNGVPLLRGRAQPHVAVRRGAYLVVDELDPADLRVAEESVLPVAEHKDVQAPGLEVAFVIEPQRWTRPRVRWGKGEVARTSTTRREGSHDRHPLLRNFAFKFSRMDDEPSGVRWHTSNVTDSKGLLDSGREFGTGMNIATRSH